MPYSSGTKTITVAVAAADNQIQNGVPVSVTAGAAAEYTIRLTQSGLYTIWLKGVDTGSAALYRGSVLVAEFVYIEALGETAITAQLAGNIDYTLRIMAQQTGMLTASWEKKTELPDSYSGYCMAGTTQLFVFSNAVGYGQLIIYVSDWFAVDIRIFDSKGNEIYVDAFSGMFIADLTFSEIYYIEVSIISNTNLFFGCEFG